MNDPISEERERNGSVEAEYPHIQPAVPKTLRPLFSDRAVTSEASDVSLAVAPTFPTISVSRRRM